MYKVIIADDDKNICEGLRDNIDWTGMGFEIVGVVQDGMEIIEEINSMPIDVIFTDIKMKTISGLDVAKFVYDNQIPCKIVFISGFREFDLALLKYVSEVHVIEDGNLTVTQTGNTGNKSTDVIPKVEIHRKKVNTTVVKFVYTIKITNEGDIPGYATEITDYVPQGLKFYEEDNEDWVDEGNNIISTKQLKGTLLNPGESATVKVTFRWINGNENLGVKTNYAEISQDYNQFDVPDRDSTPDNQVKEEDDMDYAEVLLTISTGLADNMMLYITLGGVSLVVLAVGIVMIKRYVL